MNVDLSTAPKMTIDVDLFDKLLFDPSLVATLSSTSSFKDLQKQSEEFVKKLFPNIDLTKFAEAATKNSNVESSFAYNNPHTRKIETLPKTINEYKNLFPNFVPPAETVITPSVSSLEAARPLHSDTKKNLTPIEKLLDENYKELHSTIQQALSAARTARVKFDEKILNGPIHPYQKLIYDYLGPDFKTPSIFDLELPHTFCPITSLQRLNNINDKIFENTVTHFQHLTAGIGKIENEDERKLMESLGHAFATLSATSEGQMFVIDRNKTAKYLEFAETFRNIPVKEIVNNPVQTAQRVINRLIQILDPDPIGNTDNSLEQSETPHNQTFEIVNKNELKLNESTKISSPVTVLQEQTAN